ncbi:MAG: DoxX family protein, partial [Pseudonocardia sp.]|nr:DoxX family protein [Pseudonocardia sp.]
AFVVGIASAWARGLRIDCGCFGTGGELGAGEDPAYGWDLLRDAGLLALSAALAGWPHGRFGIDGALAARRGTAQEEH